MNRKGQIPKPALPAPLVECTTQNYQYFDGALKLVFVSVACSRLPPQNTHSQIVLVIVCNYKFNGRDTLR